MKKFIMMIIMALPFAVMNLTMCVNAATTPVYDASFNNNAGALYANGTSVIINENANGETVVSWDGGSQIVPETVSVFGGGQEGTNYTSSSITMNSGIVTALYGGGVSLDENQIASVGISNIIVNGGTVLSSVNGGGLLFTTVDTSNVVIQDGRVAGVEGGGIASANVNGVTYSAGTQDDSINSFNRVNTANVTINGGTIDSTPSNYGLVYGGGQGYSYTGTANLIINSGDMSNAYVTSGGSNGYTGNAITRINGGDINIFQTVNRGTMESADVTVTGGTIENAYVGGETDPTVTGTIDTVDFKVLGGNIQNFAPGTSSGDTINVDDENYKTVTTPGTVVNNNIGSGDVSVTFSLEIVEQDITVPVGDTTQLTARVVTTPTGFENLYEGIPVTWTSSNTAVATVDANGFVTGVSEGTATITATLLNQTATTQVDVIPVEEDEENFILAGLLVLLLLAFLAFISYKIANDD